MCISCSNQLVDQHLAPVSTHRIHFVDARHIVVLLSAYSYENLGDKVYRKVLPAHVTAMDKKKIQVVLPKYNL